MTIVGGVALAASLVIMLTQTQTPLDPAWITVVICGLPLYYSALKKLFIKKKISSALLISIALTACIYIGEVFAAGEVAFIMAIGEMLEDYAVNRSKRGLSKLINLTPDTARLIDENGNEKNINAKDIKPNDVVRVLPGEKITVDGVIINGKTSIDQSIITGESLPADKKTGDNVFCGTLNCYGSVDICAQKAGKDTSLEKMIKMVKEAEDKKAPTQRIIDKWAEWLVPVALLIAIITYAITGNIERGVTVLVVFCPCALVLATPVSIIAGIGQAAKNGVLIKSGEALETMGKVNRITFDKTGTITKGQPVVCDVLGFSNQTNSEKLLRIAASAEKKSEHPLAKAIVDACKEDLLSSENFSMQAGKGVSAIVDGDNIICGKYDFLLENGIKISQEQKEITDNFTQQGKAIIFVAINNQAAGVITLSDTIKPEAKNVMQQLKDSGIQPVILTGDNPKSANYIASMLDINDVRANLLPEDKVSAIKQMQDSKNIVCMVGDGINDAPALKTADVSVAMGAAGSDIAIESANIALMSDNIANLPYIKKLSNATIKSIKTNITLSMVINIVAVALSIIGCLNPVVGALIHNAGSVLVVLNAALLYDRKIK